VLELIALPGNGAAGAALALRGPSRKSDGEGMASAAAVNRAHRTSSGDRDWTTRRQHAPEPVWRYLMNWRRP
jgi:hypothetical protein